MSVKLMTCVWDLDIPQSRKMVLLCLADQANDQGECYPGIASIAARCSCSRRAVFAALADLEGLGLLERRELPGQRVLFCLNVAALKQIPLIDQRATGARGAPVQEVHRCTTRTSAGGAPVHGTRETGARGAPPGARGAPPIKATVTQPTATEGGGAREDDAERQIIRDEQFNALAGFDQQLIEPYLDDLPWGVDLDVFAGFVRHRQVCGRVLSVFAWKQVAAELRALASNGVDLNASLKHTAALGLASPVDPRRPSSGRGPPRARANDDFSQAKYTGTPDHELPPELRDDAPA